MLSAALLLFAIVGIFKMRLPIFDFSDPNFLTQGWGVNIADGQITEGCSGRLRRGRQAAGTRWPSGGASEGTPPPAEGG